MIVLYLSNGGAKIDKHAFTLRMKPELLRRLRHRAIDEGKTTSKLIEEMLEKGLKDEGSNHTR